MQRTNGVGVSSERFRQRDVNETGDVSSRRQVESTVRSSVFTCVCLDGDRWSQQSVRQSSRVCVLTATGRVDSPFVSLHVCLS